MDKTQFYLKEDGIKTGELRDKVTEIMDHDPLFKLLNSWEGQVTEAARTTIESLYNLARPVGAYSIKEHYDNVIKLFTAIANESFGKKNAKEHPGKAINQGLMPVLDDRLSLINNEAGPEWGSCLPDIGKNIDLDEYQKAELNSYFHIENVTNKYPKTARGVFIEMDEATIGDPGKKKKLEEHLGRPIFEIVRQEFFAKDENWDKVKLGFLEISAQCDYAQKKVKLNRYVLGAMIPIEYVESTFFFTSSKQIPRLTSHAGIYRLPPIRVDGNNYIVKLSFKYQIGAHENNSWFGNTVFRIREQILADIIFRCAQYSSRPGITVFN